MTANVSLGGRSGIDSKRFFLSLDTASSHNGDCGQLERKKAATPTYFVDGHLSMV